MKLPSFMYEENHIKSEFEDLLKEYEKIFNDDLPTEPGWDDQKGMIKDIKYCIKHKINLKDCKPEIFIIDENIEY